MVMACWSATKISYGKFFYGKDGRKEILIIQHSYLYETLQILTFILKYQDAKLFAQGLGNWTHITRVV